MSKRIAGEGARLRAARLAAGVSLADLGEEVGINRHAIGELERGNREHLADLPRIYEALERLADRDGARPWIEITPEISKIVRQLRQANGWNQRQLAEAAGTNNDTISRLERRQIRRSRSVRAILRALIDAEDPTPANESLVAAGATGNCRSCEVLIFDDPDLLPDGWWPIDHMNVDGRCPPCAWRIARQRLEPPPPAGKSPPPARFWDWLHARAAQVQLA